MTDLVLSAFFGRGQKERWIERERDRNDAAVLENKGETFLGL
jgi:hypothetical protein